MPTKSATVQHCRTTVDHPPNTVSVADAIFVVLLLFLQPYLHSQAVEYDKWKGEIMQTKIVMQHVRMQHAGWRHGMRAKMNCKVKKGKSTKKCA